MKDIHKKTEDGNHIKIFLIFNFELSEESYQDVLRFNDDLLEMKYNCSYFMDHVLVKDEFDFPFKMLAIQTYVEELLSTLDIDITLPKLEEKDFNYLSQEEQK